MRVVRDRSLAAARSLGLRAATHLPLLDEPHDVRRASEIVDRCLALLIVVAHAHGWSRDKATERLEAEGLWSATAEAERQLLTGETAPSLVDDARASVESLWTLTWALGHGPDLRFDQRCPDDLVERLPNLKRGDDFATFRAQIQPRPVATVVEATDLAYLIHWDVVDSRLAGSTVALPVDRRVIENRRRALEWMLNGAETWDDISLDT